jgi:hypothetical protein
MNLLSWRLYNNTDNICSNEYIKLFSLISIYSLTENVDSSTVFMHALLLQTNELNIGELSFKRRQLVLLPCI